MSQEKPSSLIDQYDARLRSGALQEDTAQRAVAQRLHALAEQLMTPQKRGIFGRKREEAPTGLYLYGDVGRGKSMLMDLFVEVIKHQKKTRRVHFHAFMIEVHKALHALRQARQAEDLLAYVVADLAENIEVLCLDEFQVTDVTDAMILARLFGGLMDAGVTVIFTSNRAPQALYQGGLQRDQFLKFVDALVARIPVISLDSPHDYRLAQLKAMRQTFLFPCDAAADDFLLECWKNLTHDHASDPLWLEVQGRTLRVDKHFQGTAWLTFDELCTRPLGANDYLTLAKCCHTVLLQGIPKLSPEYRNEAKRFVTLIDALYDHRVKLIATAATAPDDIYPSGDGSFEFARTASRLHEMQSEAYMAAEKI